MTSKKNQSLDVNDALSQSEAFFIKNKKFITIAIVAIVVVVGGFFAARYYISSQQEKGSTQLAMGETLLEMQQYDKALNGDGKYIGYAKIARQYSMTDAGNLANAYAGICYAKLGKTKEAIKSLEAFDPQGDNFASPQLLCALANCYATAGQVDKAVETFKTAAEKADNNSISPTALIQAGILLESQNKKADALKLYQEVKQKYVASMQAQDIDKYIERASH